MNRPRPLTFAAFSRALLVCATLALSLTACGDDTPPMPSPPWHPAASSSLVLAPDERSLWVASPDDNRIVRIATDDLQVIAHLDTPGTPVAIARVPTLPDATPNATPDAIDPHIAALTDGTHTLAIALVQGTDALLITPHGVRRTPIPCGGITAVVAATDALFFACPHDDRVIELTPQGTLRRVIHAPGRPTALALLPDALAITAARTGHIRTLARAALAALPTGPHPIHAPWQTDRALETTPGFAATRVDALAPAIPPAAITPTGAPTRPARVITSYQRVDHDSDRDRPPEASGYGQVIDDTPRIDPRIDGCAATTTPYARFDGGPRVFSGPSAIAYASATGHLWIAHEFTNNIAVLDCADATAATPRLIAHHRTGRAPRGIALAADGRTAWVDLAFDHAIARLTHPTDPTVDPTAHAIEATLTRTRPLGPISAGPGTLTPTARRGRSLFHDATNTHLTPSGVVTCATCHPAGGEDGLAWFIHRPDIARKLRRTPPAYAARAPLAPYHWDAQFADAATLTRATIQSLMQGDALLIDADAIAHYLDTLPAPPGRPAYDAIDAAHITRGEALFHSTGCATCHPAPHYADARQHTVLPPATDPDAHLEATDTPSLRAVRARPPYLHDGRAATLLDVLTTHNPHDHHGATSTLHPEDLAALVRYLETL